MSARVTRPLAVAVACLLTATVAHTAPPLFVDEITVTATGEERSPEEVPVTVTVITRQEMEDAQADTVADLLQRAPGVTVARAGAEGAVTSLFTRGTESDHTLVMLDGVRLNSPYFAGFDFSQLATAGLDRVELARGPFSALWGADALGGVVNLIPIRGGSGLAGSVLAEGGGDDWERLEGTLTWGGDGFDAMVSVLDRSGREALPNSDYELRHGLADVGWALGSGGRIAVLLQRVEGSTGIPFSTPGVPSPERRQWSEQQVVAVPLQLQLTDAWRLEVSASRVDREFRFRDPEDPFGYTRAVTEADSVQARAVSHHEVGDHRLSWGGEWRQDTVDDTSSFGTSLDDVVEDIGSVFAQDVWQVASALRVVTGVRWDHTDSWGEELSPRLHLGWRVSDGVELRAGAGQAFRQPSLGELHYPGSGNLELEPETATSLEVGAAGWWERSSARWELTLFSTTVDDLIEFDPATYRFANLARADIDGVEAGVRLPLGSNLLVSAAVTHLEASGPTGDALLRRPSWSGSLAFTGRIADRLRGDLLLRWVGQRPDVDPVTLARSSAPGFATGDLALAWEVDAGLEITARVVNLADRRYEEVLGYPAPGRRLMGGLRWRP